MSDEDRLSAILTGLRRLPTDRHALEQNLVRVAQFAVQAIPGAEGAGLTLLEAGRRQTVVATAAFVREVDDIQYGLGEGPCVSAVADAHTVVSGNLGGSTQWPRFGPRVGRLGVHSALSLPMLLSDRTVGALNVYAHGRDAFNAHAVRFAETFAPEAAVNVSNFQVLAQAERLVGQLEEALTSRADIDQAIGIVMSRTGVSAAEALARLKAMSQARSVRLSVIARNLTDEATRRARARHRDVGGEHDGGSAPGD